MAAWVEVYTRCMDGEYFRGAYCPRDGHSNDTSIEVAGLVDAMRADGVVPTLDAVVQAGFHGAIDDVIVAEFASSRFAPDYFTPSDNLYPS
jgi:hypothetical protein